MKTFAISFFMFLLASAVFAQSDADKKQITLMTKAVELTKVERVADKCPGKKGITIELKVVSETPVDVARFVASGRGWYEAIFTDKKKGDTFTDFFCYEKAPFKFFSRPAGSKEEFPKP